MHNVIHWDSFVHHNTKPHKIIFFNIKGPIKAAGYNGSKYFVIFQNGINKTSKIYLIKYKAKVSFYF